MRFFVVFLSMLVASIQTAQAQTADVASHVAALKGETFWIKIDFVEVNDGIRGVDAANVLENGEVSYRATIGGFRQSQSQSAEDFAEEVRNIITRDALSGWSVRVIQRGAKVEIRKAEAREKEVYIELDKLSGARHAVRLKVNREEYTIPEVERLFNVAFAASEPELAGPEETVLLKLNMSIEEVIARKGKPRTRVELGDKTILAYDDLRLIFKDGKLVDAE